MMEKSCSKLKNFEGQSWSSWTNYSTHLIPPGDTNSSHSMEKTYNKLRTFEGQSWSNWTDIIGQIKSSVSEPAECSEGSPAIETRSVKLNRKDMPIFGHCPSSEVFELVLCNYCGYKFKIPALAEHIRLRHEGEKIPPPKNVINSDEYATLLPKKQRKRALKTSSSKSKKIKQTYDIENDVSESDSIDTSSSDIKILLRDSSIPADLSKTTPCSTPKTSPSSIKSTPSHSAQEELEPPTNDTIKQVKIKLKKTKILEKSICNSSSSSINISKNNKVIAIHPVTKLKDKIKIETCKKVISKPESIAFATKPEAVIIVKEKEDMLPNMQPVVQLSPLGGIVKGNTTSDVKNKIKQDKKPFTVRDRTFNPDKHCGVIGKENTKPCTRSLTCRSHSVILRRAVKGRSKAFDVLLADHIAEKEIMRKMTNSNTPTATDIEFSSTNVNSSIVNDEHGIPTSPKADNCDKLRAKIISQDYSKLSIPVSIKNPYLLKNINIGVPIKLEQTCDVKATVIPAIEKSQDKNKTEDLKIQVRNAILIRSKESKDVPDSNPTTNIRVAFPTSTPNISSSSISTASLKSPVWSECNGNYARAHSQFEETTKSKERTLWIPGFLKHRYGGLLSTNSHMPRMIKKHEKFKNRHVPNGMQPSLVKKISGSFINGLDIQQYKNECNKSKMDHSKPPNPANNFILPMPGNQVNLMKCNDSQMKSLVPSQTDSTPKPRRRTVFINQNAPIKINRSNTTPTNVKGQICSPQMNYTPAMQLCSGNQYVPTQIIIHNQASFVGNAPVNEKVSPSNVLRLHDPLLHYVTSTGPYPMNASQHPKVTTQGFLNHPSSMQTPAIQNVPYTQVKSNIANQYPHQ